MRPVLRKVRGSVRDGVLAPAGDRFDELDRRLAALERQLSEIQGLLEVVLARAEASNERSLGILESAARQAQRLEELERALGAG